MKGISVMEMSTIVPIVLALLVFFGSVVSALNTVEKKNRQIDLVLSLIQIVDRTTEAGVLTKPRFHEAMNVVRQTLPVNFYVCVTRYNDSTYNQCELWDAKTSEYNYPSPNSVVNKLRNVDYISVAFPVTYQIEMGGVPFNEINRMLVIVWEGV